MSAHPADPRKTILVSSSRSGTNYFLNIYSKCFPGDVVLKEIFRKGSDSLKPMQALTGLDEAALVRLAETDPVGLWTRLLAQAGAGGQGLIAKIFYYHAAPDAPLWREFDEGCRVVHLIRRNLFESYLSAEVARRTGEWQAFVGMSGERRVEPFAIDAAEADRFIQTRRAHVLRTRDFFVGKSDYAELFYEDIATESRLCAQAIGRIWGQDFSGLDVEADLRKQKVEDNTRLVLNYAEVAALDRAAL